VPVRHRERLVADRVEPGRPQADRGDGAVVAVPAQAVARTEGRRREDDQPRDHVREQVPGGETDREHERREDRADREHEGAELREVAREREQRWTESRDVDRDGECEDERECVDDPGGDPHQRRFHRAPVEELSRDAHEHHTPEDVEYDEGQHRGCEDFGEFGEERTVVRNEFVGAELEPVPPEDRGCHRRSIPPASPTSFAASEIGCRSTGPPRRLFSGRP
jgi:hypothetical protein